MLPGAGWIVGDLLEEGLDSKLPREVDVIYHLGAMVSVAESIASPALCSRVNVLGTQNLLEAARNRRIQRFILVSSVYVYGDVKQFPTPEEVCLFPTNPLGASKVAAEQVARSYSICYDLPLTVFRPFTVYGLGSGLKQFIPSLMDQALHASSIEMGDPRSTRDFIHVSDVVAGLLQGLRWQGTRSVFNLGTGVETSVGDLVKVLLKLAHRPDLPVSFWKKMPRADERHGVSRQCADIQQTSSSLSWKPKVSLKDGLMELFQQYAEKAGSVANP